VSRYARVTSVPVGSAEPAAVVAHRSFSLVDRETGDLLHVALFEDEEAARREAGPAEVYAVVNERFDSSRVPRHARGSGHEGYPMRDVSPAPLLQLDGLAGLLMLIDRRSGKGLGILFFDSEDALERGHAFVSTVPPGTAGRATDVALYDVASLT
jgi:hypothetical protein